MGRKIPMVLIVFFLLAGFASLSFGEETVLPKNKQTKLGLYITAKEAYAKWLSDPGNVKIIDCRTPEEYIFVGHAPMAHNIPSNFITHRFDKQKKRPVMESNPDFVSQVRAKFEHDDLILIMCRSGSRSAQSVNRLAEAGFKKVYSITDGFEGDIVKDPLSAFHGKRFRNGWKNAGNPWTYELDPDYVYSSDTNIK